MSIDEMRYDLVKTMLLSPCKFNGGQQLTPEIFVKVANQFLDAMKLPAEKAPEFDPELARHVESYLFAEKSGERQYNIAQCGNAIINRVLELYDQHKAGMV